MQLPKTPFVTIIVSLLYYSSNLSVNNETTYNKDMFHLVSKFDPQGDQPQAIEKLSSGIKVDLKNQVLLGVTGSGKTFTMAHVIQKLQLPTLIISHNKTLAGQLYQEMRDFFPENAVSYFVSYYDYYQPEAYVPQTDTYIEKEVQINELIDKLRLKATTNILTRSDTIVVASVSCIYNIGSPIEYGNYVAHIKIGDAADWMHIGEKLVRLHYARSEFEFSRGTFRLRANHMDIYPAYEDTAIRIEAKNGKISSFSYIDPLSGKNLGTFSNNQKECIIYPAKQYVADPEKIKQADGVIRADLEKEYNALKKKGHAAEADRLLRRVNFDLEMLKEVGYVNGIENYSRYFDGRNPGDPPYTLLHYFKQAYGEDFLVCIDESHMTVPQIRAMYNGDRARKKTLIDFGFRLEAAYDNRPLTFEEFYRIPQKLLYVSATPSDWEMGLAQHDAQTLAHPPHSGIVQQLIRPTGIIDPEIDIRSAKTEIEDVMREIELRAKKKEKTLVTTLTKKTAEDLSAYLKEKNIRAEYLHSDVKTLERSDILDNLRKGNFDVLIGVNLLREGLDLPEVTLVAILDADREGFLRSRVSLIQTMGRAARNVEGKVILYADTITGSMQQAIDEINRRRKVQAAYNKKHSIIAKTIHKPIREKITEKQEDEFLSALRPKTEVNASSLSHIDPNNLTALDKKKIIKKLEKEMKVQAENLNFELAIALRDKVKELKP